MTTRSVQPVFESGLCCSCGLCSAACPVGAIAMKPVGGGLLPAIDGCVGCGRCMRVCPQAMGSLDGLSGSLTERMEGPCLHAASAWSMDGPRFQNAVSGGVATQLVSSLLESGSYDSAFLVGDAVPGEQIAASRFAVGDDLSVTQKSKYGQASQAETLRHMRAHPNERIVVTAVPCAVRGLLRAIEAFGLERENYLLIGLFCDKTMTANATRYLAACGNDTEVAAVDFRTKDVGGWPGGVRLRLADGGHVDMPNTERMRVKEYFQPECCLYCLDKLNVRADISLGDDYTGSDANPAGANSVIVRTERGMAAWSVAAPCLNEVPSITAQIASSQHLESRSQNLAFALLKERAASYSMPAPINGSLPSDDVEHAESSADAQQKAYAERLRKIQAGAAYEEDPNALRRELDGPVARVKRHARRVLRALRKVARKVRNLVRGA